MGKNSFCIQDEGDIQYCALTVQPKKSMHFSTPEPITATVRPCANQNLYSKTLKLLVPLMCTAEIKPITCLPSR